MTSSADGVHLDVLGLGESSVDTSISSTRAAGARHGVQAPDSRAHSTPPGAKSPACSTRAADWVFATGYLGPLGNDDNGRLIRNDWSGAAWTCHRRSSAMRRLVLPSSWSTSRPGNARCLASDPALDIAEGEIDPAVLTARVLHIDDVDEKARHSHGTSREGARRDRDERSRSGDSVHARPRRQCHDPDFCRAWYRQH